MKQGASTFLMLTTVFSTLPKPNITGNQKQELWVKYLHQITSWIFISANVNHKYKRLKPIIKPFDSGWNYIQYAFFNFISLLVIWSWKCNNMLKKKIISLWTLVIWVCWTTLNIFPHWISKLVFENTKTTAKRAMARGNFLKIFRHVRSHNTMYGTVNLEHTTDITLSGAVNQNTNLPQPIFHLMVLRLKEYRTERLNLYLHVDLIKYFMLLNIVKIFLFGNLQELNHLFCLSMN